MSLEKYTKFTRGTYLIAATFLDTVSSAGILKIKKLELGRPSVNLSQRVKTKRNSSRCHPKQHSQHSEQMKEAAGPRDGLKNPQS